MSIDAFRVELRRRTYSGHRSAFRSVRERVLNATAQREQFVASADGPASLLIELRRARNPEQFRAAMQEWAVLPTTLAFNGFSGQMFLNQLVKSSPDQTALADVLVDVLELPSTLDEAVAKIERLMRYTDSIRTGAHPGAGHSFFFTSYFWALQDEAHRFPIFWSSAVSFAQYLSGETGPEGTAERYRWFADIVADVADSPEEFERVAIWWDEEDVVLLDESIIERCLFGLDEEGSTHEELERNAAALNVVAKHLKEVLTDVVSETLGMEVTARTPPLNWRPGRPRSDTWVSWSVDKASSMGLQLWIWSNGVAIGLEPGQLRGGWYEEVAAVVDVNQVDGFEMLGLRKSSLGKDVGLAGRKGSFFYARHFSPEELAGLDVREAVVEAAVALQPLLRRVRALAGNTANDVPVEDDPLTAQVERFRNEREYPTAADEKDRSDQERFRELLRPENIRTADVAELRLIWNTGRYGNPGPQSVLNTSFRDAAPSEYERMLDSIEHLCWGSGPDAERIDSLLEGDRYVKGLGESVIMKLLAVCHPERFVPVYPQAGPKGKLKMLQTLELPAPTGSRGQVQVESNRLLHERLEPFFPRDPWGMMRFLYWYAESGAAGDEEEERDIIGDLAEELFVDRAFLEEVVDRLEDKGQVVFYGPPGTGKTYLARKLAEALAPDPQRRSLVQFHPSSSYEDFFEGYRPESTGSGDLSYRLTPGPLALLADAAADAPGKRHVMIIDEINRANLPKVFGELLFLLEYRGESVQTLYRSESPFQLPPKEDLWFIGTMNTADRSIALIDAAMRRRFHFIPFFPNSGPMEPLLERWLAKNKPDAAWVGDLLKQVNDELEEALGGPHLQIGPSYFMTNSLSLEEVEKIWKYNIEPFIEDQFFGDSVQIERFRFPAVHKRYRELSGIEEFEAARAAAKAVRESTPADEDLPAAPQP